MDFEWDDTKDLRNQRKYGPSFSDARRLFDSDDVLETFDIDHSEFEDRCVAIGPIDDELVVVVYTEPEDNIIRIIGARRDNRREQVLYRSQMNQTK